MRVLASLNSEEDSEARSLGAFVVAVGKNVHREFCRTVSRAGEASPSEHRFCDTAPDPERRVLNGEVRRQVQQTLNGFRRTIARSS